MYIIETSMICKLFKERYGETEGSHQLQQFVNGKIRENLSKLGYENLGEIERKVQPVGTFSFLLQTKDSYIIATPGTIFIENKKSILNRFPKKFIEKLKVFVPQTIEDFFDLLEGLLECGKIQKYLKKTIKE